MRNQATLFHAGRLEPRSFVWLKIGCGDGFLSSATVFDVLIDDDEAQQRQADKTGDWEYESCSRLWDLLRQIVVPLLCSIHGAISVG